MKHIKEQIDTGFWGFAERRLGVRLAVSKIMEILINIAKDTNAIESRMKQLVPIDARVQRLGRACGTKGSVLVFASFSTVRPITPASL